MRIHFKVFTRNFRCLSYFIEVLEECDMGCVLEQLSME